MIQIRIPIKVDVKAKARSSFTRDQVEKRLAFLAESPKSDETDRETEYLLRLKEKKGWVN